MKTVVFFFCKSLILKPIRRILLKTEVICFQFSIMMRLFWIYLKNVAIKSELIWLGFSPETPCTYIKNKKERNKLGVRLWVLCHTHDFGTLNVKLGYVQSMIFNTVLQINIGVQWLHNRTHNPKCVLLRYTVTNGL